MENAFKWLLSIVCGAVAAFFGQYGLFIVLVAIAVVLDVLTGLIKVKATGEGLSSKKATRGFWKKTALFGGLAFGIFLDIATAEVLVSAGVDIGIDMPFALIFCAYIIINEAISISENLYLTNPDSFPSWIAGILHVAKKKIDEKK